MCGRFALNTNVEKIREQFGVEKIQSLTSFNIAPTEAALCIIKTDTGLEALHMRWGITPWYAQGKKPSLLINARAETVAEKPAFRQSLKYRRCLIIMRGFFEWHHDKKDKVTIKQPYFIEREDHQLMAVASIWDTFKPNPGLIIPSCCALTVEANPTVSKFHDRMPLILNSEQQDNWLDLNECYQADLAQLMSKNINPQLRCFPVTTSVNSALYKEADAILPSG